MYERPHWYAKGLFTFIALQRRDDGQQGVTIPHRFVLGIADLGGELMERLTRLVVHEMRLG